ncbi:MAG: GIY-YIG nuclease family protein [Candidatus Pacebacteria bacterium]|nr:GIY-YIG nuclease family protein [Candidatus Paceibacterota bacterium]
MCAYCLYILESQINKRYYVGATNNLKERIVQHNKGRVKSTKSGKPWKLKYYEKHISLSEARKRELQVKKWKKRAAIEKLINYGPIV